MRACPRLAPGSGCGSVADDTAVCNGVEPAQTAARSRPFGPTSLTRVRSASSAQSRSRSQPAAYWMAAVGR